MTKLAFACLLLLGACKGQDFEREGTWRATGANDSNLRSMLADPSDETRGVAATTSRGTTAAQAVIRLDEDRRRPLPDSRAAQIGGLATQAPGGGPPSCGLHAGRPRGGPAGTRPR